MFKSPKLKELNAAFIVLALSVICVACGSDSKWNTGNPSTPDMGEADVVVEDDTTTTQLDATIVLPEPRLHRPVAVACSPDRAPQNAGLDNESPDDECELDSDCTDGLHGRCTGQRFGAGCTYDLCTKDSECGGEVCSCDNGFNGEDVCLGGNCVIDSDCGINGYCSPSFGECGDYEGFIAYYCRTAADECLEDEDCDGEGDFGNSGNCSFSPQENKWMCSYSACAG